MSMPGVQVRCPCCGESIELVVDDSVEHQQYIEDCQVCCRPITVVVAIDDGRPSVSVSGEND